MSTLAKDRIDLEKRQAGQQELDNMLVKQQGGLIRRPGTEFMEARPITGENPYPDYKLTYLSENGIIWGIPITDTTVSGLDSAGEAIEGTAENGFGVGNVAIPMANHPFEDGWIIYITGTTHYSGNTYTVQSGSTDTDYIIITESYNAETFSSSDKVSRYITMTSSGGGSRMCQDSDGIVYVGTSWTGNSYVTKITTDGTKDDTFLNHTWTGLGGYSVFGIRLSPDESTLYVMLSNGGASYVYAFTLSTGNELWATGSLGGQGAFWMDIADNGWLYLGAGGDAGAGSYYYESCKLDPSDGSKTSIDNTQNGQYMTVIDDDMVLNGSTGVAIFAGINYYDTVNTTRYDGMNIHLVSLDGNENASCRIGDLTLVSGTKYKTITIGSGQLWTDESYVYVVDSTNDKLYQLNSDLSVNRQISLTAIEGGYYDIWGNLVLVCSSAVTPTYFLNWYDTFTLSLIRQEAIANFDPATPLSTWSGANPYMHGESFFWPGVLTGGIYNPSTYLSSVDDYAVRLIPFEYSTDTAYILELGEQYVGFYKDGAQVTQ